MVQMINALSYPYFERLVWAQFKNQLHSGHFDLVHRITPLSPTIASPIARKLTRANVPFILGPLNGGVPWPAGFDAERRREKEWLVVYLPENGIDPARFAGRAHPPDSGPLKACFIGRMVPYKGPDMLLDAAEPLLRAGQLQIDMIGDGPMTEALKQRDLPGVTWHGWTAHEDVQAIAKSNHLLAFPSIREFGGGVVLEAMALGVVPLIVDYAGPGELVQNGLGLKTPLGDRAAIVEHFRAELSKLAQDRSHLAHMGKAAADHVQKHFVWPQKAKQVRDIYDWALNAAPKPNFIFPENPGESDRRSDGAEPQTA